MPQADYTELNPALDPRIPQLFPFKGHLWAFMRCVLFHPDYSPFILREEQFTLATRIIEDYKNYVLTVGDIYYYVACFVEKRDPAPPGVTRSAIAAPPRKIPLQNSAIANLLEDDDIISNLSVDKEPEVNAQIAVTAICNLADICIAEAQQTGHIENGTLPAIQLGTDNAGLPRHDKADIWGGRAASISQGAMALLFDNAPDTTPVSTPKPAPRAPALSQLFTKQKVKTPDNESVRAHPDDAAKEGKIQAPVKSLNLRGMFSKRIKS
jgi:hypothetical protein